MVAKDVINLEFHLCRLDQASCNNDISDEAHERMYPGDGNCWRSFISS